MAYNCTKLQAHVTVMFMIKLTKSYAVDLPQLVHVFHCRRRVWNPAGPRDQPFSRNARNCRQKDLSRPSRNFDCGSEFIVIVT